MNYFFDCGGHHGEGLLKFIDMFKMDKSWNIFSYEPNKKSFEILKSGSYGDCQVTFENAGVWIQEGEMVFHAETTSESYGGEEDGAGSTFMDLTVWDIKRDGNYGAGDYLNSYKIKTVDFPDIISKIKNAQRIIIKLDVEGAEYEILRKMISDGSIENVTDLFVEFHHWALSTETAGSTQSIIDEISKKGISIHKWG